MDHPKVDIAWVNDGWYALYLDGKKVYEGDGLSYHTVLDKLGIEHTEHHANEALAEDGNAFADDLDDLVIEREE